MLRYITGRRALTGLHTRTLSSKVVENRTAPIEWRRFAVEMGTGTSLRREDHTAASVRAVQDALWRISLTAYRALVGNTYS